MIARGMTAAELGDAAQAVGVRLQNVRPNGTGTAFTLALDGERYRRRSHTGRKIAAVCWHGHYDFFREVYTQNEEATIITAQARYNNRADFEYSAETTGDNNIGSMVEPMAYRDACDC